MQSFWGLKQRNHLHLSDSSDLIWSLKHTKFRFGSWKSLLDFLCGWYYHICIPWGTIVNVLESPVILWMSLSDKWKERVRTWLGQTHSQGLNRFRKYTKYWELINDWSIKSFSVLEKKIKFLYLLATKVLVTRQSLQFIDFNYQISSFYLPNKSFEHNFLLTAKNII